jgi:hypothetical protein
MVGLLTLEVTDKFQIDGRVGDFALACGAWISGIMTLSITVTTYVYTMNYCKFKQHTQKKRKLTLKREFVEIRGLRQRFNRMQQMHEAKLRDPE